MAGVLELEIDGVFGCGRRSYCSEMVVSTNVDYLQNKFLSSREMIPALSKVDGRRSYGREMVASNDGNYLQRELASSSKMVPASSKLLDHKDTREAVYGAAHVEEPLEPSSA